MITRVDLCGLYSNPTSVDPKIRERNPLRNYSTSTPNNDAVPYTRTPTLQGQRTDPHPDRWVSQTRDVLCSVLFP